MKITESQLKRIIKEEVLNSLESDEYPWGLEEAEEMAKEMIRKLDSIAEESAQENSCLGGGGSSSGEFDVEDYFEPEERQVLVNGREMFIVGTVSYEYHLGGNYGDDAYPESRYISLAVMDEDGEETPLDIDENDI